MTNEKSTAKTKDEMRWAMVRPELEAVLEEMWLARVLPLDFGAALERLRLWREMSQEELARDAQLPEATVSEIIGEKRRGRLHNVMRMCIAARLPWDVSAFLLNQGGYCLRSKNRTHVWYRYVLKSCVGWSLEEVQIFLEERGVGRL